MKQPLFSKQQRGVALLEALITMVVVSVGLLGVAALQLKSLQFSYGSYQRTLASVQANDLVERLWANLCVLSDDTQRNAVYTDWEDAQKTHGALPGWAGALAYDSATGLYTITISWEDRRVELMPDGTPRTEQFSHMTRVPQPAAGGCP